MNEKPTYSRVEAIGYVGIGLTLLVLLWHCNTYYAAVMGAILH